MVINIKFAVTKKEIEECLLIRRKVFIEEQGIPEKIETDDDKTNATSIYALIDNKCVGTARYQKLGNKIKLERFAVLNEYRLKGVGRALAKYLFKELDNKILYLHAQESVIDFYLLLGFKKVGDKFYEAGIPHWKMIKK